MSQNLTGFEVWETVIVFVDLWPLGRILGVFPSFLYILGDMAQRPTRSPRARTCFKVSGWDHARELSASLMGVSAFITPMARQVAVEASLVIGAFLDRVIGPFGLAFLAVPASSLRIPGVVLVGEGYVEITFVLVLAICWACSCLELGDGAPTLVGAVRGHPFERLQGAFYPGAGSGPVEALL